VSKRLNPDEILRQNPQIDLDELDEARELLRRLRDQGSHRKDYDLVPPFGGHRVTVLDDVHADSRPIRMRRPYVPE
jgi:hypothetical protein